MKQPLLLTLLLLFPFLAALAQEVEELGSMPPQQIQLELALEKIEKDGKFGLADPEGRIVIPPMYSAVQYRGFEPNVRVKLEGKFGIIDSDNKILVPFKYDEIRVFNRRTDVYYVESQENGKRKIDIITDLGGSILPEGAEFRSQYGSEIKVTMGGKTAIIDGESGVYILKPIYDRADAQETIFRVCQDGKCGVIDRKSHKIIIPLIYDAINGFVNNLSVTVLNGKFGVINEQGKIVIPFEYDKIKVDSYNRLLHVKNNEKSSLFNVEGKQLTAWYDDISSDYYDHFHNYRLNHPSGEGFKYGYVDQTGKDVTGAVFDRYATFHSSSDCIELQKDGETVYLTKEGKIVKKNCK
jgi:hypothetical protein